MSTTAEYDAFGPWIYEIHSQEEIPRLFRDHGIDLDASLMTIKVPREIERRVANPSMDLYDMVVSLGPERVTALSRRGRAVDSREVAYTEIQGITDLVDLLRGRLILHAESGPLEVPYNASSTDIVSHVVQVLRRQYLPGGSETRGAAGRLSIPKGVEDDLANLYRRVARENGVGRTVGIQTRRGVTPVGASGVGRAMARAWPTTLQSAVITVGEREVVVLHRGKPFSTGRRPVHSLARTMLPLERVVAVDVRASQTYEDVSVLQVRVGPVTHEYFFDAAAAPRIATELRAAAGL